MHEARLCPIGYGGLAATGLCTRPGSAQSVTEVLLRPGNARARLCQSGYGGFNG